MQKKTRTGFGISFRKRLVELIGDEKVAAFSRKCGLPQNVISKYLEGSIPSVDRAQKIAVAAGVNLEWLASGEGPKHRNDARTQLALGEITLGEAISHELEKFSLPNLTRRAHEEMTLSAAARRALAQINTITLKGEESAASSDSALAGASRELRLAKVPMFDAVVSAGPGAEVVEEPVAEFTYVPADYLDGWGVKPAAVAAVRAAGDSMVPLIGDGDLVILDRAAADIRSDRVYAFSLNGELRIKRLARISGGGLQLISQNSEAYPPVVVPPDELHDFRLLGRVVSVLRRNIS